MSKKVLLIAFLGLIVMQFASAQTVEELKATRDAKKAELDAITAEVEALDKQIYEFPGWKFGGVGTVGFDLITNNNWFAIGNPNSASNGLGLGFTGYANQDQEKYFWRNGINVNLNRTSSKEDKSIDGPGTVALSDLLDVNSLFGYKLTPKLAISAEGKWLSSLINFERGETLLDDKYSFKLNNPGQLTVSAGITWLPITDLVVMIHPLGYQKNWPGEFISSAGAKIGATYTKEVYPGIKWNSNLSAFIPYSSGETVQHGYGFADPQLTAGVAYSGGDLINYLWTNSLSFTVWKGIGVGLTLGLRGDNQIANSARIKNAGIASETGTLTETEVSDAIKDNVLQSFFQMGLSYGF